MTGEALTVRGQRFSVVGAGRSGIAAANVLAARGGDVALFEACAPVPRPDKLAPEVQFIDGSNATRPGDVAVLSPGVPEVSEIRAQVAGVSADMFGEVELFYRLCPAPILAITGTDGKSTTTTMLGAIAEAAQRAAGSGAVYVGGNLGNPLCEGLDGLSEDGLVIAEVSCFQLTTCRDFRPRVAIVTNIAEDHLNYHGSFAAYQAAKRRIWAAMTPADTLILNGDDPAIAAWSWPAADAMKVRTFSLSDPQATAFYADRTLYIRPGADPERAPVAWMSRADLPLFGLHNVANALAAGLAATAWGIDLDLAREALRGYEPLPHRLATLGTDSVGVRWVNDSKATNPNAATAGITAIEDAPVVLMAGGSVKDTDFTELGEVIRRHTKAAVLFGETRHALSRAIGSRHPQVVVTTLDDAMSAARRLAAPGDTVLLSPACASFDQFDSYAHRGEAFTALVRALPGM